MNLKTVTPTLLAAAILLSHASASDHEKSKSRPAAEKVGEICLDGEIERLESALDRLGRALGSRVEDQSQQLAAAKAELKESEAKRAELHRRVSAAEVAAKNITTEFNSFKASNEKQRQATMASLAKIQQASQQAAEENARLRKRNQELEAGFAAASSRLKALAEKLEQAEKKLAGARDSKK